MIYFKRIFFIEILLIISLYGVNGQKSEIEIALISKAIAITNNRTVPVNQTVLSKRTPFH